MIYLFVSLLIKNAQGIKTQITPLVLDPLFNFFFFLAYGKDKRQRGFARCERERESRLRPLRSRGQVNFFFDGQLTDSTKPRLAAKFLLL